MRAMNTHSVLLAAAAATLVASAGRAVAQPPPLLISQGTTMYRYENNTIYTFQGMPQVINGMTNVPAGMTVGNMNGGASGGDVLALGTTNIYRVDTPFGTPTLVQIGVRGGTNASPVFVGTHLYGIGGQLPQGSVLTEWNTTTFAEINLWATGIFGGPGGMVNVPGTTDEFYYAEFNNDAVYHYRLGDNFSTFVCSTPNNDYVGWEMYNGTIYASYALPGTQQFVVGVQSLTGTFTQLAVLDSYGIGITGLTYLVPTPTASGVLAAASLLAFRRRR